MGLVYIPAFWVIFNGKCMVNIPYNQIMQVNIPYIHGSVLGISSWCSSRLEFVDPLFWLGGHLTVSNPLGFKGRRWNSASLVPSETSRTTSSLCWASFWILEVRWVEWGGGVWKGWRFVNFFLGYLGKDWGKLSWNVTTDNVVLDDSG